MQYLEFGIRCLIGTVFLAAAVGKAASGRSFAAFTSALGDLGLVPLRAVRPVAVAVVAGEALVCLLLAAPWARLPALGLTVAAVLLLAFAAAIACAVARGTRAVCRCFGGASAGPLGARHIVRNVLLAGLALAAAGAVPLPDTGSARPAGLLVAALGGLLVGGCVAALDTLAGLFRPMGPVGTTGSRRPVRPGR
ncbi:MauE/DoxX family redox-associated membrane protein [Streptomyces sp. NPDC047841]|uniref:MauE/DoxX family redox-associated membrane protein n=1 Tax=Streptomyces sp. NPDC047841 TaxID=3154708 RepID=UPI003456B0CE